MSRHNNCSILYSKLYQRQVGCVTATVYVGETVLMLIFMFFRCFVVFQLFLILHFLSFVEFQPALFCVVLIF